jgi:ADP-ribose pyrophosphatase
MSHSKTHYPDLPRVAVGGVVIYQNKVLLVLRGKAPAKGLWAIPGGSVQLGESLKMAVEREVWEETGLHVEANEVIYVFENIEHDNRHNIEFHYVILDLRAELVDPTQPLLAGDDAEAVGWFTLTEVTKLPISATTLKLLQQIMRP